MEKDQIIELYVNQWDRASDFLDKAILTLSTSTIWLVTLSDIQEKVFDDFLFNTWVTLICFTLTFVLLSYVLAIHNCQLWINYFSKNANTNQINKKMGNFNKCINIFRYLYVLTSIIWILFLVISILNG